jgi:hypothetical protein
MAVPNHHSQITNGIIYHHPSFSISNVFPSAHDASEMDLVMAPDPILPHQIAADARASDGAGCHGRSNMEALMLETLFTTRLPSGNLT